MQDRHDVAETGCLLCRTPLASVATATALELIPGRLAFLLCESCASLLEMPARLEPLPHN